jgi:hypothetical protein
MAIGTVIVLVAVGAVVAAMPSYRLNTFEQLDVCMHEVRSSRCQMQFTVAIRVEQLVYQVHTGNLMMYV